MATHSLSREAGEGEFRSRRPGGGMAAHGAMAPPHGQGFTLLEMVVVITLIAIIAAAISVSMQPDPRQALAEQARRVGLLMDVAADEARLQNVRITWEADLRGYRFVAQSGDRRETFSGDDLLRERTWDPPLKRLEIVDLGSGAARTLIGSDAPPLSVPVAREWVQPPWRLELTTDRASVTVDFDAKGHATVAP